MNTKRKLQSLVWIAGILFVLLASVTTGALAKSDNHVASAPLGGQVVPAGNVINGYSLAEAAAATSYFNTGPRTKDTLPEDFPFQILYIKPDGSTNFSVGAGRMFYVPVIFSDDTDLQYWPLFPDVTNPAAVSAYYFDPAQLGGDYFRIIVDGQVTDLGPEYAVGAVTPGLPSGGNNYTVVAAFLTRLPKGMHTVTIAAHLSGAFILGAFGGPYEFEIPYTVVVK